MCVHNQELILILKNFVFLCSLLSGSNSARDFGCSENIISKQSLLVRYLCTR